MARLARRPVAALWLQVPPRHKQGTAEDLKMPFIIEMFPLK